MKVSCIIPAYNEESTIRGAIRIVRKIKLINEIIIVDDGSSDNTYATAKLEEGAKVLRHHKNKGKGAAIKTGIKSSNGDVLLFLDGDLIGIDSNKISRMIQSITEKDNDAAIGYFKPAYFQTFTQVVYMPLMQLLFPEVLSVVRKGHLSGQRAFKREIIGKMILRNGFDLEASMNIDLAFMRPGPKIAFVNLGEITLRPKGYQKSMCVIADFILSSAVKSRRIERLHSSSFPKVACELCESLKKYNCL